MFPPADVDYERRRCGCQSGAVLASPHFFALGASDHPMSGPLSPILKKNGAKGFPFEHKRDLANGMSEKAQ
jgi:hypothetical protein